MKSSQLRPDLFLRLKSARICGLAALLGYTETRAEIARILSVDSVEPARF
jgi:hypothetical protein